MKKKKEQRLEMFWYVYIIACHTTHYIQPNINLQIQNINFRFLFISAFECRLCSVDWCVSCCRHRRRRQVQTTNFLFIYWSYWRVFSWSMHLATSTIGCKRINVPRAQFVTQANRLFLDLVTQMRTQCAVNLTTLNWNWTGWKLLQSLLPIINK